MDQLYKINPLVVGDDLPDFSLLNQDQQLITKQQMLGKTWLLYFYPKASTPGCTIQAQQVRDNLIDVETLGVSPDPVESLCKFISKESLNFNLLSDLDKSFALACGVYGERNFYGVVRNSVHRIAFLIDPQGKVIAQFKGFKTADFAALVKTTLEQLKSSTN